jgi:anti-sigma factor RsiW
MSDDDLELEIQLFLDGELRAPERLRFLRRLSDDHAFRARVLSAESLLDVAARLPRPLVPGDFVARTMARVPQQGPALAPPGPRVVRRWGFVPVAAAASVAFALTFWAGREQGLRMARPAVHGEEALTPREVFVRLLLIEPGAHTVAVVGDFNGWDAEKTPLERADGGVFRVTLPLEVGRYHYMFVVDGNEWRADPLASETSPDGFGSQNSVLDVQT